MNLILLVNEENKIWNAVDQVFMDKKELEECPLEDFAFLSESEYNAYNKEALSNTHREDVTLEEYFNLSFDITRPAEGVETDNVKIIEEYHNMVTDEYVTYEEFIRTPLNEFFIIE